MDAKDAQTIRYARNLVARIPEPRREAAERYLVYKANAGVAANTIYNAAKAAHSLSEQLGEGERFEDLDEATAVAFVARLRRYLSGSSVHHTCVQVRTFLTFLLDVDTLPRGLRRALTVRKPRPVSERRLVSKEQFEALLEAAGSYLLRAWLAIHPEPGDPQAPLHPQQQPGPECRRTTYDGLLQMLRTLCKRSGLPPLSPHDFRHTWNTKAARYQWDPQLREKKAGWAPGSKMSSHYTHLVDDDLVAQVRRDAGTSGSEVELQSLIMRIAKSLADEVTRGGPRRA